MEQNSKISVQFLTAILSAEVTVQAIEALKETTAYKHEVKATARVFESTLYKYSTKGINQIWGVDDEAMYALIDYQKSVVAKIATMRPEDIGVVAEMIDMYQKDPEGMRAKLEIEITSTEK